VVEERVWPLTGGSEQLDIEPNLVRHRCGVRIRRQLALKVCTRSSPRPPPGFFAYFFALICNWTGHRIL
jgi:hypothetical protein